MVSAITSFDPMAFLNQVKGTTPAPQATGNSTGTGNNTDGTSTTDSSLSSSLVSLLTNASSSSSSGNAISALLGGNGSTSDLLGGTSPSDPLSGLYSTLLYNATTVAPLQNAINDTQAQATQQNAENSNPVQNALTSYFTATNAYNQTLLQNAQSALANNSSGPGGTPLVA